ncbi:MAG TPA: DUF2868 domain-containing protein [Xanthomonadales bacterium]|nr:DUF2868 domain-containing protein [Xanthomonadales bacterium]
MIRAMPVQDAATLGFLARWRAEAIRLREASGVLDDSAANAAARTVEGDAEHRILVRAARLAADSGDPASESLVRLRLLAVVGIVLAAVTGFGSIASVLGFASQTVNVVWALVALLALPSLLLLLWLTGLFGAGLFATGSGRGAGLGAGLGRLSLALAQRFRPDSDPTLAMRALYRLVVRAGALPWLLGAISHAFWAIALTIALLTLSLALSVWRYGFVWQTTILPADTFVVLVETVGWLPARLGVAIPDPELIRASGETAVSDPSARRAWSAWLASAVLLYGGLPRVILLVICGWQVRRRLNRLRLDLDDPYHVMLAARLAPASERLGIRDPERLGYRAPRLATGRADANGPPILISLECDLPSDWQSERSETVDAVRIDDRHSRQAILTRMAAEPPSRLLLVCGPNLSPDRGAAETITELSRFAGQTRLALPEAGDPARQAAWLDLFETLGLAPDHLHRRPGAALTWLYGAQR